MVLFKLAGIISAVTLKIFLYVGTLESGTVTAGIAAMGLYDMTQFQRTLSTHPQSAPPPPIGTTFSIEASSKCFEVPVSIIIPSPMTFGPPPASEMKGSRYGPNDRQVSALLWY